ncbi:hypothetical protein GCM10009609_04940 [Pseudonocardia aurantiaca]
MNSASPARDTLGDPATINKQRGRSSKGEAIGMLNISVSSRSLAAARSVDPNVSPAAVRAAVEVALAEMMRQLGRQAAGATRSTAERSPKD